MKIAMLPIIREIIPRSKRWKLRQLWYHWGWLMQSLRQKKYGHASRILRVILLRIVHDLRLGLLGNTKRITCEMCGWRGNRFYPGTDRGTGFWYDSVCPNCNCLPRHRLVYRYLREKMDLGKWRARILEIGPWGPGALSGLPKIEYITVDIQKLPYVSLCADATELPFPEGIFDIIICNNVLCMIPDDLKAVSEMNRVCKQGGKILLYEPFDPRLHATDEFNVPRADRHGAFRWYGRDFTRRFSVTGLNLAEDLYAFELPSHTIKQYGLLRHKFFIAAK